MKRSENLLLALLPLEKRGKIIRLQAANQYVEVTTDKGTYDLRSTLKSAMEMLPESHGIHLHRSIWLHRDQIKELGYENGNPCVYDSNGEAIPVSRNKVPLVKKHLNIVS